MKNEKGFTLIEMLIAMVIGIILLGTAVYTYSKQDKLLREENRNLKTRDFARLTMDQMVNNLLQAGYGLPPGNSTLITPRPARGITNADVTTVTYLANTDDVSTNSSFDRTSTVSGFLVPVGTQTAFAVGDEVVFFNVEDPEDWVLKTLTNVAAVGPISGINYGYLDWTGNNVFDFKPIDDEVAVVLNKYHTITYTYNSGPQTITVTDDQGSTAVADTTITIANNVSNLTFSYFDMNGTALTTLPLSAADRGDVRKIGISITIANEDDTNITETLTTDINLRNMGI